MQRVRLTAMLLEPQHTVLRNIPGTMQRLLSNVSRLICAFSAAVLARPGCVSGIKMHRTTDGNIRLPGHFPSISGKRIRSHLIPPGRIARRWQPVGFRRVLLPVSEQQWRMCIPRKSVSPDMGLWKLTSIILGYIQLGPRAHIFCGQSNRLAMFRSSIRQTVWKNVAFR